MYPEVSELNCTPTSTACASLESIVVGVVLADHRVHGQGGAADAGDAAATVRPTAGRSVASIASTRASADDDRRRGARPLASLPGRSAST